jgi:ferredoxin
MAVVITRLCQDCVDGACVDSCPVDAIVEHRPADRTSELPNQLFVNPDLCISCNQCTPECPWEAIYDEGDVPPAFSADIALNRRASEREEEYHVPVNRLLRGASSDQVEQNRAKWLRAPQRDSKAEATTPSPDQTSGTLGDTLSLRDPDVPAPWH